MSEELIQQLQNKLAREQKARAQAESLLEEKSLELYARNQELSAKAEALEKSNAELEQFAYVVSHDLQAPLRNIMSFTKLLERELGEDLGETPAEYMAFISDAVLQMKALIEDILALSRVSNRGEAFTACDLQNVMQEAINRQQESIRETQGQVNYNNLPTITADKTQMVQLFQNLIGNALKFKHPDRDPVIDITAEVQQETLTLRCKDNGIGIAEEHHERVFGVFTRLHTDDDVAGTGIGLSICKKIVDRHQGQIQVQSQLGEGTSFVITLPIGDQ